MGFDPEDRDVIALLTKLKDASGEYPEHLLGARRQSYLRRMTEIGLGIDPDMGIRNAAENSGVPSVTPITGKLVETVLVLTIIVETSAVAYLYRDKLADIFKTFWTDSRVQEVTPAPIVTALLEVQGVSPAPAIPSTSTSATVFVRLPEMAVTATSTPVPGVADENNSSNPEINQVNSTPVPNGINNGNNGNHYGQTPRPERTKENSGNNDQPPNDNDNKSPKDEPKPTKAK